MQSHGAVVQLVRIPACHAGGRGFEPRPLRQEKSEPVGSLFLFPLTSPYTSYFFTPTRHYCLKHVLLTACVVYLRVGFTSQSWLADHFKD